MRLFETRHHRMKRETLEAGFLDEWRVICAERFTWWGRLDPDRRVRLEALTLDMIATKSWEAAKDFDVTDEMMLVIASQAALLILELSSDSYRHVKAIVVHPSTMVMHGEHSQVSGLVSDDPVPILGQANFRGPVLVSWDQVNNDARHAGLGHNVVFHEFAHKIDMLDGSADGTPPMATQDQFDHWVKVCTHAYEQAAKGRGGHSLRSYAGVNPAEFFAVATESFFSDPRTLNHEHWELYSVLEDFYKQDPLNWTSLD